MAVVFASLGRLTLALAVVYGFGGMLLMWSDAFWHGAAVRVVVWMETLQAVVSSPRGDGVGNSGRVGGGLVRANTLSLNASQIGQDLRYDLPSSRLRTM